MSGSLNPFIDLTGKMSSQDVTEQNVQQLIQQFNDQQQELDSLTGTLNIVGYGQVFYNWDGTIPSSPGYLQAYAVAPVNISSDIFLLSFMQRSDVANRIYNLPYQELQLNANGDGVLYKSFLVGADYSQNQVYVNIQIFVAGAPITFTFNYYLVQQPANAK